jgi:hypothetical protein
MSERGESPYFRTNSSNVYRVCAANSFSIVSSRFSIESSLFSICLSTLPESLAGKMGCGVGDGHFCSSGLSGRLGGSGYAAVVSSLRIFIPITLFSSII